MKKMNKNKCILTLCASEDGASVREVLAKVGDKWSLFVLVKLAESPKHCCRFSELKRSISGISQRMLTTTLRNLERDGMLTRQVFPEVPLRVEYQLTSLGKGILDPVRALTEWTAKNWHIIKGAREKFDKK